MTLCCWIQPHNLPEQGPRHCSGIGAAPSAIPMERCSYASLWWLWEACSPPALLTLALWTHGSSYVADWVGWAQGNISCRMMISGYEGNAVYRGSLGRQSLLPLQQDNLMSGNTTLATSSSCVISCVQQLNQLFLLPSCFGQSNRWTLHRVQSSTLLLYDQPVKRRRSMCEKGLPTYVTEEKYAAG